MKEPVLACSLGVSGSSRGGQARSPGQKSRAEVQELVATHCGEASDGAVVFGVEVDANFGVGNLGQPTRSDGLSRERVVFLWEQVTESVDRSRLLDVEESLYISAGCHAQNHGRTLGAGWPAGGQARFTIATRSHPSCADRPLIGAAGASMRAASSTCPGAHSRIRIRIRDQVRDAFPLGLCCGRISASNVSGFVEVGLDAVHVDCFEECR